MERKRKWCLRGEKVLLVPYSAHHVSKYHEWMQNPVLRSQTASEPLTLQQEYEMQLSWMRDEDSEFERKLNSETMEECTFIVLSQETYDKGSSSEIDCMVGDVNLFFTKEEEEEEDGPKNFCAEINIMIAEPPFRGQGLGVEATKLMISYGTVELGILKFHAKISTDNHPSLKLFQDKLNFVKVSHSEVFGEVTLELKLTPELIKTYTEYFHTHSQWHMYEPRL